MKSTQRRWCGQDNASTFKPMCICMTVKEVLVVIMYVT